MAEIDYQKIKQVAMHSVQREEQRYNPHYGDSDLQRFAPYIVKGIADAFKEYDRQKST